MIKVTKDQYKTVKIHPDIHYILNNLIAKQANSRITDYAGEALYKQMIIDFGEKEVSAVESNMPSLAERGYRAALP